MAKNTIASPSINVNEVRKELEGIRAIAEDLRVMLDKSTPHPTLDHNIALLEERVTAIDSLLSADATATAAPVTTPAEEVPQS